MVTRLKTLSEVEMAFRNEKQSIGCLKMGLKDSWSFSHFKKNFAPWKGFFALWISRCEIPAQLCVVCLQMAITSSFQIQIMHRLKHWIPNFSSFKMIYGMYNLSSSKYFKNVSKSSKIFALEFALCEIFASCFAQCETILILKVVALVCQRGVSHGVKIFAP